MTIRFNIKQRILLLFLFASILCISTPALAEEVVHDRQDQTIQFSIPEKTNERQKGTLPRTNEHRGILLVLIGLMVISFLYCINKRKKNWWGLVFLSLIPFSVTGEAQTLPAQQNESPITIEITPKTLSISEVSSPKFDTYSIDGNKQKLISTTDLSIKIKDLRIENRNSFKVYYSIDFFKNEADDILPGVRFHVGEGTLHTSTGELTKKDYESFPAIIEDNQQHLLFSQKNKLYSEEYIYTIPKHKLFIELPENAPQGNYSARQSIYLSAVSEAT